ncbi:MAG: cbb3-type cytochrome c oxidase subunit I, partial [Candidatus Acidiferrales bacterium]
MLRAKSFAPKLFFVLAGLLFASACYVSYFWHNSPALDLYLHDTYYVVSHDTPLLFLSLYFAACGLAYYVYPKIAHRQLSPFLAHLHFWASLGFITVLFFAYLRFATHAATFAVPAPSLQSALGLFFLSMLGL